MKLYEEAEAAKIVHAAIDRGLNFIDTGPNYSNGHAEERLGRILGSKAKGMVIATKVGTQYVNGNHVKDYSRSAIEQSVVRSMKRLNMDHIPLLQLHGMAEPLAEETVSALSSLKQRGLVRYVGVSTDGPAAEYAIQTGVFDCLMIQYNLIVRQEPERIISSAAKSGVGILVKSPLAQTLYGNDIFKIRGMSDLWYLARALKNHRSKFLRGLKFRFVNHLPGWEGSQVALRYVLNNPNISSAIIGTTKLEHLLKNIETTAMTLPDEIIHRIEDVK